MKFIVLIFMLVSIDSFAARYNSCIIRDSDNEGMFRIEYVNRITSGIGGLGHTTIGVDVPLELFDVGIEHEVLNCAPLTMIACDPVDTRRNTTFCYYTENNERVRGIEFVMDGLSLEEIQAVREKLHLPPLGNYDPAAQGDAIIPTISPLYQDLNSAVQRQ